MNDDINWLNQDPAVPAALSGNEGEEITFEDIQDRKTQIYNYVGGLLEEGGMTPSQAEKAIKLLDRAQEEASLGRTKGVPVRIKYLNLHFSQLFFTDAYYKIIWGGAGTGKSHCALGQYPLKRLIEEENILYYAVRLFEKDLKPSVFDNMKKVAEQEGWMQYLKFVDNGKELRIISLTTGSRIEFKGLQDVNKFKSYAGITGFLMEEASEIKMEDFDTLDFRIRGGDDSKKEIIMCFNPTPDAMWIKERFLDKTHPKVFTLKCHYTHNRFLTKEDLERFEEMKHNNPEKYRIYTEGDFYIRESRPISWFTTIN